MYYIYTCNVCVDLVLESQAACSGWFTVGVASR